MIHMRHVPQYNKQGDLSCKAYVLMRWKTRNPNLRRSLTKPKTSVMDLVFGFNIYKEKVYMKRESFGNIVNPKKKLLVHLRGIVEGTLTLLYYNDELKIYWWATWMCLSSLWNILEHWELACEEICYLCLIRFTFPRLNCKRTD